MLQWTCIYFGIILNHNKCPNCTVRYMQYMYYIVTNNDQILFFLYLMLLNSTESWQTLVIKTNHFGHKPISMYFKLHKWIMINKQSLDTVHILGFFRLNYQIIVSKKFQFLIKSCFYRHLSGILLNKRYLIHTKITN